MAVVSTKNRYDDVPDSAPRAIWNEVRPVEGSFAVVDMVAAPLMEVCPLAAFKSSPSRKLNHGYSFDAVRKNACPKRSAKPQRKHRRGVSVQHVVSVAPSGRNGTA